MDQLKQIIENIKFNYSIANDDKVIRLSEQFLKQEGNGNNYEVLWFKAQSLKNLFQHNLAIETFEIIISNYPEKTDPLIEISICFLDNGEYKKAKTNLEKALKLEPNNLDIISNLIFIEESQHNYTEVIKLSTLALGVDNKEPSIWLTMSSAYSSMGHYQKALDSGYKAIEYCGDDVILLHAAYNDLGYTYSKMNDLENAELQLNKAIEIDNSEPFAYNNLGLVIAKRGNIDEGLKLINHSLSIDDQNSYVYKNRAKLFLMTGNIDAAKSDLLRAKELDYDIDYDNEVNELLDKM